MEITRASPLGEKKAYIDKYYDVLIDERLEPFKHMKLYFLVYTLNADFNAACVTFVFNRPLNRMLERLDIETLFCTNKWADKLFVRGILSIDVFVVKEYESRQRCNEARRTWGETEQRMADIRITFFAPDAMFFWFMLEF